MEHRVKVKELKDEAAYAYHLTQAQVFFQPVNRDYSIFRSVVLTFTPITGGRLASGSVPGFRLCRLKVFYSKARSGEDDEEDEEMYEPIMARGKKKNQRRHTGKGAKSNCECSNTYILPQIWHHTNQILSQSKHLCAQKPHTCPLQWWKDKGWVKINKASICIGQVRVCT